MLHGVLDERLNEERRHRRTSRVSDGASIVDLELRPEPRLLEVEVALHVRELLVERHQLAGPRELPTRVVGKRADEPARAVRVGPDQGGDRVQRVEDEVRLHLRLHRRRRRRGELRQLELRRQVIAELLQHRDELLVERRPVGGVRDDGADGPVRQPERDNRGRAERARRVTALDTQAERREERPVLRERLEHGADRDVACAVMVGARADERQDAPAVGDRRGADAELLEELVGERSRSALGQPAPELRQRRGQELEGRHLAPDPAVSRHDRMMHVTEAVLAPLRDRYGEPAVIDWEGEISPAEHALATYDPRRMHDVTLFILDPRGRLALIRKPHFEEGVWRPPGGGIKADEDFTAGAEREALEETGLRVRARAVSRRGGRDRSSTSRTSVPWRTHVFLARTTDERLQPRDTVEIAGARWGTLPELAGPIRARLLATGRALWRYRVALHDAALQALGASASE